eukprot:comp11917_c0_seq1/m.6571 comp11917_c0_seq1/g.6571  ORF comp11917_c0_seq1/g.6571 comp11917_c0_seq1/m.6571 type:complete len:257 (-) comp11917_c0_seq1:377-1147(-)
MDSKGTKVYVGNLNPDSDERDLRDEFERFGRLNDVWVARKPPGFGFVWYDDPRDAEDACRALDGRELRGSRIRVEISRGGRGPAPRGGGGGYRDSYRDDYRGPPPRGGDRDGYGTGDCYECGRRGHFARECPNRGGGGYPRGGGFGRRSPPGGYRGRSPPPRDRRPRSRSRSPPRRRSRSPPPANNNNARRSPSPRPADDRRPSDDRRASADDRRESPRGSPDRRPSNPDHDADAQASPPPAQRSPSPARSLSPRD